MNAKNGTFEKFKNFKIMIEDGKNKIRMLRIGRGVEFLSKEFNSYCEHNGIRKQLIITETKQGLTRSNVDHNLYHMIEGGKCIIIILNVDDLVIT